MCRAAGAGQGTPLEDNLFLVGSGGSLTRDHLTLTGERAVGVERTISCTGVDSPVEAVDGWSCYTANPFSGKCNNPTNRNLAS